MSSESKNKTAAVFPGQGSQKPGMGRYLHENWPKAAAIMKSADEILDRPISKICLEGPKEILDDTENSQPAVFLISAVYWEWLKENAGVDFEYLAGHSLGEYSALYAAGVADFETTLTLVEKRAKLMRREAARKQGKMAAVLGLDITILEETISKIDNVEIANYNCPGQTVISGSAEGIAEAEGALARSGAGKIVPLAVSGAFHSSLMTAAAKDFEKIIEETELKDPSVPVIGNVDAEPLSAKDEIKAELTRQITSPVRWEESISYMIKKGVGSFVEAGPGRVLKGLIGRIDKEVGVVSMDTVDFVGDFQDIAGSTKGRN